MYTARFVYIHQDSYTYIKIRIYRSRFVYIDQDSYIYIEICIYTLRFVQFRHKGKYDRWIDCRVFKPVSIKHGLRTTDYGQRTTDYGLRTTDYGQGIKHGLGIKRGLSITDWV